MGCLYQLNLLSMKNENNNQIFQNLNINSSYLNELLKTDNITQHLNILVEMDKISLNDIKSDRKLLKVYRLENEKDLKVNI
jgi:hypothetical protein